MQKGEPSMAHEFIGKWISDTEMAHAIPRNVFFRQLERKELDCSQHRNLHILFRKRFFIENDFREAHIYISADDYYKLYINGSFAGQGPAPSYHFQYNYNVIDIAPFLQKGENLIAVHTLYQGLINRVWQSGDERHGMICDLVIDGKTVVSSGEDFLTQRHTAYREIGVCGYATQFLEEYDSRAPEVGFSNLHFDDREWKNAHLCVFNDRVLCQQTSKMLTFERIEPLKTERREGRLLLDFGANYVGYLCAAARGRAGDVITVRCAQELNEDGSPRFSLRANCVYEETWILSGVEDALDWFDYKAFRYVELIVPDGATVEKISLLSRHYPFEARANLRSEYAKNDDLCRIWQLCRHTQKYGVQEVIQDCPEREKGFYLGDGCYTALANMLLTGDDSMVRKLIDDAFASSFITDTLVTCMNCSFMQEIAEYPLIMILLILWHYRLAGDREYLQKNYTSAIRLLDAYRRDYEKDGLLRDLDKWCVVEWPKNFQHGYDADIREGKVCRAAHVSINAYYIGALRAINKMADILGEKPYRDEKPLLAAFHNAFYDPHRALFVDREGSDHASLVGNVFPYAFGLCPNEESRQRFLRMLDENGIHSLSMFCTFPTLMGLARDKENERIRAALLDEGAWLRMLAEGATTTFEGWGKDTKWNTSLFHLTMSYAAVFLADIDLPTLFA